MGVGRGGVEDGGGVTLVLMDDLSSQFLCVLQGIHVCLNRRENKNNSVAGKQRGQGERDTLTPLPPPPAPPSKGRFLIRP